MLNCLLAGVGGQGTVLASRLIAQAAMDKGEMARTAETIGMAQRGGCVVSHVRTGQSVHSSFIPKGKADIIIGFEPGEAVRVLPYLKKDGTVVVACKEVKPVTASLGEDSYHGDMMLQYLQQEVRNLILVDGDAICEQCGSYKVLNVALLGAAIASGTLDVTKEEMLQTIRERVPAKFAELNETAFQLGMQANIE